ncbi:MAG: nitroreductase family protein [Paludibacteraceae bacterium]
MNLTEALQWRYATKRMVDKKVPQNQIDEILEAIHLTPTAFGLEPYKVIVVENKKLIQDIYEKACPQIVVQQCSHLLIFKSMKSLYPTYIESFLKRLKETRQYTDEMVDGYRKKIVDLQQRKGLNIPQWAKNQTYIAMAYATIAAADLQIDATPIEGFNPEALDALLNLDEEQETTTILLTLGYRDAANDHLMNYPKVRKPLTELVEII